VFGFALALRLFLTCIGSLIHLASEGVPREVVRVSPSYSSYLVNYGTTHTLFFRYSHGARFTSSEITVPPK
jgi:hypothetical protein